MLPSPRWSRAMMFASLPLLLPLFAGLSLAQEELGSVDVLLRSVSAAHVDHPAEEELRQAAVEGLLLWLERHDGAEHLQVLTRRQYDLRMAHARGERFGVGIGVLLVPGYGIRILEVFTDTPADHAGLVSGDVIVAVDGNTVENRPILEVAELLAAREGEYLLLELVDRQGQARSVQLTPERYDAPPISVSDGEDHRIVRLHHFGPGAAEQLWRAIELAPEGHELVIDLRDVRDGLLVEAVGAAAPFLGDETTACFQGSGSGDPEPLEVPLTLRWEQPLAILINAGTQGVAELFAAMIQRANTGLSLVGTPTAGIDALPIWVDLGSEYVLQLPGTRLSLADGTTWGRVGVVPDVVVDAVNSPQLFPPPAPPPDLQIDAALRLVNSP